MAYYTKLIDNLILFTVKHSQRYEIWREIDRTSGRYFISNRGRALSLCRGKYYLLQPFQKDGYQYVSIRYDGDTLKTDESIHRLVALAFIPNPEEKPNVHHIDTDKQNNDVANLVWLTDAEHGKAHKIINRLRKNG